MEKVFFFWVHKSMCLCLSPSGPNSFHYQSISETVNMHLDCGGALAPHCIEVNWHSPVQSGPSLRPDRHKDTWASDDAYGRSAVGVAVKASCVELGIVLLTDVPQLYEFRSSWCLTSTFDLWSTDLVSGVLWNALTLTKQAFLSLFSFWSVESFENRSCWANVWLNCMESY